MRRLPNRAALVRAAINRGCAMPPALWAAIVAAIMVGLAYGPDLLQGRVLLPVDMLEAFPPWSAASIMDRPVNPLLGDQLQQMYPWRVFIHQEIAAGRLPVWNPYAGGGVPLFANGQSAVLFP